MAGELTKSAAARRGKALRWRLALSATLAAILLPGVTTAKKLSEAERTHIDLIRGLQSEISVAKVALPRGTRGIFLDSSGKIDQKDAESELRLNGAAIRAGMPAEITRLIFKSNRIVFEINGGGKSGKKWYQRIEVGVGGATQPISQQPAVLAYGSQITLTFAEKLPKLTTPQVKQMLGSVLDFERHSPTVLYSPTIPPQFKDAIKKHEILVGMDRDTVLSSKGPPDRRVRETRNGNEQEDWIYGLPPHPLFVTFDGDTVISVKQY